MPSTFALIAVQMHAATSKSASPLSKVQHLLLDGGCPITTFTRPRRSAHKTSFNVSRGKKGSPGDTFGGKCGLHVPQVVVMVAERRNEMTRTAAGNQRAAMREVGLGIARD